MFTAHVESLMLVLYFAEGDKTIVIVNLIPYAILVASSCPHVPQSPTSTTCEYGYML